GNIVAFTSQASPLVPGAATTTTGIFVRDVFAAHTVRITPPGPFSEVNYLEPSISDDGSRVLYRGSLVRSPTSFAALYDRPAGTTRVLDIANTTFARLAPSGRIAVVVSEGRPLRVPVDLGPGTEEGANAGPGTLAAVSPDGA